MKDLMLVIDVQNVYFPGQPWACPSLPRTVNNIKMLLDSPACGRKFDVLFTQYLAAKEPKGRWAQYNAEYREINEDPDLSEIAGSLKPYLDKWPVCDKHTYSSCYIPEIREAISDNITIGICDSTIAIDINESYITGFSSLLIILFSFLNCHFVSLVNLILRGKESIRTITVPGTHCIPLTAQ